MSPVIESAREALKSKIRAEGEVLGPDFLRVDSFLNHKVSPLLLNEIGKAMADKFRNYGITKVLTAEAAGNIIAFTTAKHLSDEPAEVEVVYAKKGVPNTMTEEVVRIIKSPTKQTETALAVSGHYFTPEDRVLIVDDFLFTGKTAGTLTDIMDEMNVSVEGYGFVIRKVGSGGFQKLSKTDIPIFSLVTVKSMNPETGEIVFTD